jgi:hypothetical protein
MRIYSLPLYMELVVGHEVIYLSEHQGHLFIHEN